MISGYLGLGRLADGAFTEHPGYVRPEFFVSMGQPATGSTPWIDCRGTPPQSVVSHGALYADETGPRAVLTWPWLQPWFVVPATHASQSAQFPPVEISITWSNATLHALNASFRPDYDPDIITVERGAQIGVLNGQPLLALLRLAFVGGNVVPRASIPRRAAA